MVYYHSQFNLIQQPFSVMTRTVYSALCGGSMGRGERGGYKREDHTDPDSRSSYVFI